LIAVGWFLDGISFCSLGLLIANLINRIWPVWACNLKWEDIEQALENMGKYGATGSHLCYLIKLIFETLGGLAFGMI
jgi:hypothetical protein